MPARDPTSEPVVRRRPRVRGFVYRILSVVLAIVVALVLGELALRVLGLEPERHPPPRWLAWNGTMYVEDGMWGGGLIKQESRLADRGVQMGEYVPGAKFKVAYSSNPRGTFDEGNSITFQINDDGFRGPAVAKEKPADTFRILGVGDSFTFGVGVRDRDTYLRQLEADLNRDKREDTTYQVLNLGVQGYNTHDEVLTLEHRWLEYDPDLVLIAFYLNDAYSDATFANNGEGLGIYLEPAGLGEYSVLADHVQHFWRSRQLQRDLNEYYMKSYFADAESFLRDPGTATVDWNVSRWALAHAKELSRQHGFGLALVIFPELHSLDDAYPFTEIHRLVARAAEESGIPVLDLFDVYRGHDESELWVHPTDHHPNERAHALATKALAKFLKKSELLEPTAREEEPAATVSP